MEVKYAIVRSVADQISVNLNFELSALFELYQPLLIDTRFWHPHTPICCMVNQWRWCPWMDWDFICCWSNISVLITAETKSGADFHSIEQEPHQLRIKVNQHSLHTLFAPCCSLTHHQAQKHTPPAPASSMSRPKHVGQGDEWHHGRHQYQWTDAPHHLYTISPQKFTIVW